MHKDNNDEPDNPYKAPRTPTSKPFVRAANRTARVVLVVALVALACTILFCGVCFATIF